VQVIDAIEKDGRSPLDGNVDQPSAPFLSAPALYELRWLAMVALRHWSVPGEAAD